MKTNDDRRGQNVFACPAFIRTAFVTGVLNIKQSAPITIVSLQQTHPLTQEREPPIGQSETS